MTRRSHSTRSNVLPFRSLAGEDAVEGANAGLLVDDLTRFLAEGQIAEPRSEARDIVAALCEQPRFFASVSPEAELSGETVRRARRAADLRRQGAPFAYAVGRAAFRCLTLGVDERVLVPRQETEVLVELVLDTRRQISGGVAADIGTGSGAIALALATEGRFDKVVATDISADAITVARSNAAKLAPQLRAEVAFRAGPDVTPLSTAEIDVLVSNPPYIAFDETRELPASVRDWEPSIALLSASGGLAVTRAIVAGARRVLRPGGLIAFEVDARRASLVAEHLATAGPFRDVRIHQDLTGRERFVLAIRD